MKFTIINKPKEIYVPKIRKNKNLYVYLETLKFKDTENNDLEVSFEVENKGATDAKDVEVVFTYVSEDGKELKHYFTVEKIPAQKRIKFKELWWKSKKLMLIAKSKFINAEVSGEEYFDETCERIKLK